MPVGFHCLSLLTLLPGIDNIFGLLEASLLFLCDLCCKFGGCSLQDPDSCTPFSVCYDNRASNLGHWSLQFLTLKRCWARVKFLPGIRGYFPSRYSVVVPECLEGRTDPERVVQVNLSAPLIWLPRRLGTFLYRSVHMVNFRRAGVRKKWEKEKKRLAALAPIPHGHLWNEVVPFLTKENVWVTAHFETVMKWAQSDIWPLQLSIKALHLLRSSSHPHLAYIAIMWSNVAM